MNRTFAALFVVGVSFLAAVGIQSSNAADSADEVATTGLDDGLLRWLLQSRWWHGTPGQPSPPTVSDISHDSLTVSWTAPESAVFEIVDYDVQYRAAGASGFADWDHDGTATQATITDLAEVTEYQVRVRAVSEVGEGDWSAIASGTTLVAPPEFREGASTTRELNENTPPGEPVGEPITATVGRGAPRYSLEAADADAFAINAASGQLLTRQGIKYDHEARDSYAVEVQAEDVRGGTARIAVRIDVLDVEEPPGKPGAPSVSAFGSTGLRVTWTAPSNEGPEISGYDVEYRARGTEAFLDAEHEGAATRATITGLARQTPYEVRVRAVNDEGTGAWSDTAQGRTLGSGGGGSPDLVVQSVSVSDGDVDGGESFTLSATVRNQGNGAAAATMLRYYRSSDTTISTSDTHVGSDSVGSLAAAGVSNESIGLTAPANAGTYHYGACADSVAGESNTGNNCSSGAQVTVKSSVPDLAPADQSAFDALFVGNFLSTENYFIQFLSGGRFRELDKDPGDYTYSNSGPNTGTVTQTYDDTTTYGGSCTIQITFVSVTDGTLSYMCAGGQNNTEDWRLDPLDPGSFNIEIIWVGARRTAVDSAFQAAAARWESVIVADINAIYLPYTKTVDDLFRNGNTDKIFGIIDDLRIYARIATIDGVGGSLALAGPRFSRVSSELPAISAITLDADDVGRLKAVGLRDLVAHEMAHTLGFGAKWDNLGLLRNPSLNAKPGSPVPDTHFDGAKAIMAFDAAGGSGYTGAKVPVENRYGSSTADNHWRNSVFGLNELMNGFRVLGATKSDAMSLITIQSMADMGYTVDVTQADAYTLPSTNSPTMRALARGQTLKNWIPYKCIVTSPVPADEVTLIELKSSGHP